MNKKGEVNTKVIIVLLLILVVGAGIFAYNLFFKEADIIIPNFKNMTETDINNWIDENKCEDKVVIKYEYSEDIDKGDVIYQSINEGTALDDTITITISKGSNPDTIIDIEYDENTTADELSNRLNELGFTNVNYVYKSTNEYQTGRIISVEPSSAKKSEPITVTVASNETIKVPDFSSYTKNKIDSWAKENGIEVVYSYKASKLDKDAVVSQSPAANEKMALGEKLNIVLSSGSSNTATIPTDTLLGISESDFIAKLKALGFTNLKKDTVTYFSALSAKSTIFSYDDGTFPLSQTINYAISEGKYPDSFNKTDYEGKTLTEAKNVVSKYNERNAHITLNTTEYSNNEVKEGTLYDCSISYNKPNSTVSCKLAKATGSTNPSSDTYATLPTNYLGKTEADFINSCKSLGFTNLTKDVNHFSTTIEKNTIAYYDPDGYLLTSTKITYALCAGAYWDNFNAADYNGKTISDAKAVANKYNDLNAHIVFTTKEENTTAHTNGTLYDCTVSHSGTTSTVSCKLAVNSGSASNDDKATLPTNLLGYSEADFINKCKSLGFTNISKGAAHYSTTQAVNTIAYYDPDGELLKTTKITYGLSLGAYYNSFNAADYNGKTLTAANSVVTNYNNINAHITLKTTETETSSVTEGTLYDCSVSHSGTNSTVSCKLAKKATQSNDKATLLSSDMIKQNYSKTSYNDTVNTLNSYFTANGFTNVTYEGVSSDKAVGQIISVTINGSTFKQGEYAKTTPIVVKICNKTEN